MAPQTQPSLKPSRWLFIVATNWHLCSLQLITSTLSRDHGLNDWTVRYYTRRTIPRSCRLGVAKAREAFWGLKRVFRRAEAQELREWGRAGAKSLGRWKSVHRDRRLTFGTLPCVGQRRLGRKHNRLASSNLAFGKHVISEDSPIRGANGRPGSGVFAVLSLARSA